jgi:hypothetical protein
VPCPSAGMEWGNQEFWTEFIIWLVFVADFILSFFTTQLRGEKEIFRLRSIARTYLCGKDPNKFRPGWVFIDLVSLTPDAMTYFPLMVGPFHADSKQRSVERSALLPASCESIVVCEQPMTRALRQADLISGDTSDGIQESGLSAVR